MHILIPTDFSDNAYNALAFVYENFKREKLTVTLIHTIKQPSGSSSMVRIDDLMMQDAEKGVAELKARLKSDFDCEPGVLIRNGYLKDWIDNVSDSLPIDFIAMGTKGENDIASKWMGSVTESIIRTSKIPVLAIPVGYERSQIKNITIATEKEELPWSSFLGELSGSLSALDGSISLLQIISNDKEGVANTQKINDIDVRKVTVIDTDVVNGINSYISTGEVDMLCLYHSKNSRLDYLFNRSITKTICAKVELPLLVLPAHG